MVKWHGAYFSILPLLCRCSSGHVFVQIINAMKVQNTKQNKFLMRPLSFFFRLLWLLVFRFSLKPSHLKRVQASKVASAALSSTPSHHRWVHFAFFQLQDLSLFPDLACFESAVQESQTQLPLSTLHLIRSYNGYCLGSLFFLQFCISWKTMINGCADMTSPARGIWVAFGSKLAV